MASTLNGTGITFSDGSTQNSGNAVDNIGTYAMFWSSYGTRLAAGSTISGSYLFRATAVPNTSTSTYSDNIGSNYPVYALASGNLVNRTTSISGGNYTLVPNSGTWRCMTYLVYAYFDGCNSYWKPGLFVRVS